MCEPAAAQNLKEKLELLWFAKAATDEMQELMGDVALSHVH
jgi:hypothetical protein